MPATSHSPHKKGQLARSQLALTAARRNDTLTGLGKRRIVIDRDRHRDRKTKARQAFPSTGRGTPTRKATARITVCGPLAA